MNPIIDRLTATLNARTEAALAQLDELEQQIAAAVRRAEQDAQDRIQARLQALNSLTTDSLDAFQFNLGGLLTAAVADAVNHLAGMLDRIDAAADVQPEPITVTVPEPEPIAMPEPSEPVHLPVAAHAVESQDVAVLPEDDEDDLGQDDEDGIDETASGLTVDAPADAPAAADTETTYCPDGLHEKHGQGRKTHYEPVSNPEHGRTYHRKVNRRWQAAKYVGI